MRYCGGEHAGFVSQQWMAHTMQQAAKLSDCCEMPSRQSQNAQAGSVETVVECRDGVQGSTFAGTVCRAAHLQGQCAGQHICRDSVQGSTFAGTVCRAAPLQGQCAGQHLCRDSVQGSTFAGTVCRAAHLQGQCAGQHICRDSVQGSTFAGTVCRAAHLVAYGSPKNKGFLAQPKHAAC
jgi:hypothetical protein